MPTLVDADISSIQRDGGGYQEKDWTRLVSAADMAGSNSSNRYFRCWQNGRLIIDEAGWDYLPGKEKGRSISFGSDGRVTKRLFIDGETTCLFSDHGGLK